MGAKYVKIDNREMMEFSKKMGDLKLAPLYVEEALENAASAYLTDVIRATPVNKDLTAPTRGNLKAQWSKDNQNLMLKIREVSGGYMIELINTTPYASWVEKGHNIYNQFGGPYGWCMGQFFVRKTEVKWQNGKLDRVLTLRINKWLKELFM